MTDPDLPGFPEHLDLAFGDGPAHRPLDARLVAGRRALRRRRAFSGLGGLVAVAVIATTYGIGTSGGQEADGLDPAAPTSTAPIDLDTCLAYAYAPGSSAGSDSSSASESVSVTTEGADPTEASTDASTGASTDAPTDDDTPPAGLPPITEEQLAYCETLLESQFADEDGGSASGGFGGASASSSGSVYSSSVEDPPEPDQETPVLLGADGAVHTAAGVDVVRRVPNPLHLVAPDHSVALVYTVSGTTRWGLATVRVSGECARWTFEERPAAARADRTLERWLQGDEGPRGLLGGASDDCGEGLGSESHFGSSTEVAPSDLASTVETDAP